MVSSSDAEIMVREVNEEEIKKALYDINDNKAPGRVLDSLRRLGLLLEGMFVRQDWENAW